VPVSVSATLCWWQRSRGTKVVGKF
jgi:hypothetical protein